MGFSDSPMRKDHPTIYEVLQPQALVQVHAAPIMSQLAVQPCCMSGQGAPQGCVLLAWFVVLFAAGPLYLRVCTTSCSTVTIYNAALLNIVHAMACSLFFALSDFVHSQGQHVSRCSCHMASAT